MKEVEGDKKCPDGFITFGMANFWTINEGCYCDFKFQKADLLVEGACSENDLKNGCVDIKGSN